MLSIVVPVHNSETNVAQLVTEYREEIISASLDFEIVLVDDGSQDGSWAEISRCVEVYPEVKGICLARNVGQHLATWTGVQQATGEIIITVDDDLQYRPKDALELYGSIKSSGVDLVFGVPKERHHGAARKIARNIYRFVGKEIFSVRELDDLSSFRAFRQDLVDLYPEPNASGFTIDSALIKLAGSYSTVEVNHDASEIQSRFTWKSLVRHALEIFLASGKLPYRQLGAVSTLVALAASGGIAFLFLRYLAGNAPEGFTFLAITALIIIELQVFFFAATLYLFATLLDRQRKVPRPRIKKVATHQQDPRKSSPGA